MAGVGLLIISTFSGGLVVATGYFQYRQKKIDDSTSSKNYGVLQKQYTQLESQYQNLDNYNKQLREDLERFQNSSNEKGDTIINKSNELHIAQQKVIEAQTKIEELNKELFNQITASQVKPEIHFKRSMENPGRFLFQLTNTSDKYPITDVHYYIEQSQPYWETKYNGWKDPKPKTYQEFNVIAPKESRPIYDYQLSPGNELPLNIYVYWRNGYYQFIITFKKQAQGAPLVQRAAYIFPNGGFEEVKEG